MTQFNAWLISNSMGANGFGLLRLFSGTLPSDCHQADPSGLIAEVNPGAFVTSGDVAEGFLTAPTLPVVFNVTNSGSISCYRVYWGGSCWCQGTVTEPGGGGNLTLDTLDVIAGQQISLSDYHFDITVS